MLNSYVSEQDQIYLAKLAARAALAIKGVPDADAPAALDEYYNTSFTAQRQSGRADQTSSATVVNFPPK